MPASPIPEPRTPSPPPADTVLDEPIPAPCAPPPSAEVAPPPADILPEKLEDHEETVETVETTSPADLPPSSEVLPVKLQNILADDTAVGPIKPGTELVEPEVKVMPKRRPKVRSTAAKSLPKTRQATNEQKRAPATDEDTPPPATMASQPELVHPNTTEDGQVNYFMATTQVRASHSGLAKQVVVSSDCRWQSGCAAESDAIMGQAGTCTPAVWTCTSATAVYKEGILSALQRIQGSASLSLDQAPLRR